MLIKSIWTFFVLFSFLMQISCQSLQEIPENDSHTANPQTSSKTALQPAKVNYPNYKLTGDILFSYMLGELSKQNKDFSKAFEQFYSLAVKTADPRIAKIALRVALKGKKEVEIYNAIQLWSKLEPQTIDTLQIKAVVLLKINKDKQATQSLLKLFKLVNNNEQNMSRVGVILSSLSDYSRIKVILAEIVNHYPDDYFTNLYLAKFALKYNDLDYAEKYINKSMLIKPKSGTPFLLKASLYKSKGMLEQEILVYEKAINTLDESDQTSLIRLEYLKILLQQKQRDKAIEQLEYIVKTNSGDKNILFSVGMLAMEINEYDYAKQYFTMIYHLDDNNNQGAFLLGILAYKEGDEKLALHWFEKVDDIKYGYESMLRIAIILSQQKKYNQAVKHLDKYLSELKTNAASSSNAASSTKEKQQLNILRLKADILYQGEDYEKAYTTYTQALKLKPKNAELLYSRAMVAEKLGEINLSEKDLLLIIKDDPKNSNAFNALGFILTERTTRYDDARKYIEKALQITPNDMAILDSMGWVLYKMGHLKESLHFLDQAYNVKQDPEIAAHYGEALWAAGYKKKAQQIWQSALNNNPEHIVLKTTIHNHLNP